MQSMAKKVNKTPLGTIRYVKLELSLKKGKQVID
jgi:hypothetical protein